MQDKTLRIINLAVLFQQQRYIVAISFLFYLSVGLTLSDFLLFQSIFYFTGLIAEIPAGYIGDIFPRKNVLICSYLLFMLRIILWITIPNYYTLLFGEILYGLSKAFYRGVSDGYIYDYLKLNKATNLMLNKYGKFNFFTSLGSAISCLLGAWLYKYLGFGILLGFELFFNSAAVLTILFLPQIPQTKPKISFWMHVLRIFDIIKNTIKDSQINIFIMYGGILSGITSIFIWNFQPIMKSCAIPVALFGVVYFVNHILRALGSMFADKLILKTSLIKIGWGVWVLYLLSFSLLINVTYIKNIFVCVSTLIFVCVAIGIQMVFSVGNVSRIHDLISSNTRATTSSINSMFMSLFSGMFLMFFKFLTDNHTIRFPLVIFTILFLFVIVLLNVISSNRYKIKY